LSVPITSNTTDHALKTLDSPGIVEAGPVTYNPYMTGYLGSDLAELIKLKNASRIDYVEFESGDFTT
jgi:hypothetical protein